MDRRKPRHVRFDGEARLDELQWADECGDVVETVRLLRRWMVDERSAAGAACHQFHLLELVQHLANGGSRRAEREGELSFGRQLVAVTHRFRFRSRV